MLKKIQRKVAQLAMLPAELRYQWQLIRHAPQLPTLAESDQSIVETLKKEGVCVTSLEKLGLASTDNLLQVAKQYLEQMQHIIPKQSLKDVDRSQVTQSLHPQIFTVTDLPKFANFGEESRLLHIIENYIGLPIAFQGIHLRRDFANPSPITTELWHQDLEDRRILKVIVYLSDVLGEEDGPFEYIPKSTVSPLRSLLIHRRIAKAHALGIDDTVMQQFVPQTQWKKCFGPVGTVVLMDPKNIFHHGKSRLNERAALFYVYTSANPLRPEHCKQYRDKTFARPEFIA